MMIKEITALRKAGRLDEAQAAAEQEFARNANNFTANALFWCLYKRAENQSGDELAATAERMKSLYADHCNGDQLMQQMLTRVVGRTQPDFQSLTDAIEKVKAGGNFNAVYRPFEDRYNAGNLDRSLYPDFGRLTYYVLKNTPVTDANRRKTLLNYYLNSSCRGLRFFIQEFSMRL